MPRARKLFLHNSLIFVTFRTEEGLPFVPTEYMNALLWSALAKAQHHYPVEVCAFNFELNHAHMMLRVTDPELVPNFIGYLKQESAHAVNRLLGRRRKTVWAENYDCPTILDENKALDMFGYLFLNPIKDNLADCLDDYPGVSSWALFKSGRTKRTCTAVARSKIPQLRNPARPSHEENRVLGYLKANNPQTITFELSPYSWKLCFDETRNLLDGEVRKLMLERIEENRVQYLRDKHERKLPKPKPESLKHASMIRHYIPKTFGRRMICLSSLRQLRRRFLSLYRDLCEQACDVLAKWRHGDWHIPFPIGLFPPCMPRRSNLYLTTWS